LGVEFIPLGEIMEGKIRKVPIGRLQGIQIFPWSPFCLVPEKLNISIC